MFIKLYLVALPIFFAIDLLWLGVIAKNVYRNQIGFLLKDNPNWPAAITFYLLFIAGLIFFVVMPAVEKNSLLSSLLVGAFFGFITYMTYELTNYALVKDWPWQIVVVDIIWGIVLSASVSFLTHYFYNLLKI